MSVNSELTRIENAKAAIRASIESKGVSVPDSAKLDDMPSFIDNIKSGIDTSDATAIASDILMEKTAYVGGEKITGTFTLEEELSAQDDLLAQIQQALQGKASGGGGDAKPTQRKTVDITSNGTTEILPDDGFVLSGVTALVNVPVPEGYIKPSGTLSVTENGTHDAENYKSVSVNVPIPDGYIKPSGTLEVVANGTHNAKQYENVKVNVPIPDGYIIPSGTTEISANGTYDVTNKKSVVVSVPERQLVLQNKEVTENGTYTADAGYDGLGQVTVNVQTGSVVEPDYKDLYQRVEYITSAEEATYPYIITDFVADNTCGLEVVASFPVMQDRIPMGSRTDGSTATRFYCVYPLSTSSVYYGFNGGSSISCSTKVDTIYRLQTNFLNSRLVNVYEENGTRKASASLNATLADQTVPVSIFGYNSGSSGAVSSKREYKLYSARCSRKHEVVRNYVPCYRKSDGVVGVYETLTGQFLTNSAATGSFVAGPEIDW